MLTALMWTGSFLLSAGRFQCEVTSSPVYLRLAAAAEAANPGVAAP